MPENNTTSSPAPSIQNVPLPGFYDCLTWQLNVTVHPQLDSIKWVSVVRDPKNQIELSREFGVLQDWGTESMTALRKHLTDALWALAWAGGRMHQ